VPVNWLWIRERKALLKMSRLKVESVGIPQLISLLRSKTWMVPSFQREFVWSEADVTNLILSVVDARPIGMATLWEQPEGSGLHLEAVSIHDALSSPAYVSAEGMERPSKFFAVLDGRQRCTALAMAFAGLRASDGRRRFSGAFYLDITQRDSEDRVRYVKDSEVRSRGLAAINVCIANGLIPLECPSDRDLFSVWLGYLQAIRDPSNYSGGQLPPPDELDHRDEVLKSALKGINETVLAVYIVPSEYSLGEICEIFETLNTTGTKVSTVDLLHSWLYADTADDANPVLLRDWIESLGELEGAVGWASRTVRPELIAQTVTACYVALDGMKPEPRSVGNRKLTPVTSMKAGDLLATPPAFWRQAIEEPDLLAQSMGGYQLCVADGYFPMNYSPYPVTIAMYCALRWYMVHDSRFSGQWTLPELDALFRAFFWRNALSSRYDQGFLTQSASDIRILKELLFSRADAANSNAWASHSAAELERLIPDGVPLEAVLGDRLLESKPFGALGKAFSLPIIASSDFDLLNPNVSVGYMADESSELHHIYPKDWCRNNRFGDLRPVLDPKVALHDYANSVANLALLTRDSNNWWKAQTPGQALERKGINYANAVSRLQRQFISKEAFELLTAPTPDPLGFWTERARTLATHLIAQCRVDVRPVR